MLWTLVTDGIELDRLGSGGVIGIVDDIGAWLSSIDLSGNNIVD